VRSAGAGISLPLRLRYHRHGREGRGATTGMEAKVRTLSWAILLLALAPSPWAWAQAPTVERSFKGQADKDVRVGVYANVQPDCTSGPLPTIRLTDPPANGRVIVRRAKIGATNVKQCLALQVPGLVAFYRSRAGFSGADTLSLEVKYPNGKIEIQRITVTVSSGGSGQSI
jgi:hypothetical protein